MAAEIQSCMKTDRTLVRLVYLCPHQDGDADHVTMTRLGHSRKDCNLVSKSFQLRDSLQLQMALSFTVNEIL